MLLLAGCSKDDTTPPSSEPAPAAVTEDAVDDVVENVVAEEPADEVLEVVEESDAEPDSDEATIVLAQADTTEVARDYKYKEGEHYARIVPTQPTVGGADKIEVAEFFWYGCPHCFDFEPFINKWAEDKPANTRFVRIPAMWNRGLVTHAQLYYTAEVLSANGTIKDPTAFHMAVFTEYHQRNNRLSTEVSIQAIFERFGVSADDFQRTWKSFEVNQKLRVAEDLARRYGVQNVPTVIVNGKYRTGGAEAGSYPALLEVINELVARESVR